MLILYTKYDIEWRKEETSIHKKWKRNQETQVNQKQTRFVVKEKSKQENTI